MERALEEDYLHLAAGLPKRAVTCSGNQRSGVFKPENFEAHEIRVVIHDGYTLEINVDQNVFLSSNILKQQSKWLSYLAIFLKR